MTLLDLAEKVIQSLIEKDEDFTLNFTFICKVCSTKCTFVQPFTFYEKGECCYCGYENYFTEGGFEVEIME